MGRAERGGEPGRREHQQGACVDPWIMGLYFEKESAHQSRTTLPTASSPEKYRAAAAWLRMTTGSLFLAIGVSKHPTLQQRHLESPEIVRGNLIQGDICAPWQVAAWNPEFHRPQIAA
jgi:hypothetical protein